MANVETDVLLGPEGGRGEVSEGRVATIKKALFFGEYESTFSQSSPSGNSSWYVDCLLILFSNGTTSSRVYFFRSQITVRVMNFLMTYRTPEVHVPSERLIGARFTNTLSVNLRAQNEG